MIALDHALSMASNLVATSLVAWRSGATTLGAFALVQAVYVFYLSLQRAVISEPSMSASLPVQGIRDPAFEYGLRLSALMAAMAMVPLLALGYWRGGPFWVLALLLPVLGVQDHIRFAVIRAGKANLAVLMDSLWLIGISCSMLLTPDLSAEKAILLWGLTGALSVLGGFSYSRMQLRRRSNGGRSLRWWVDECSVQAGSTWPDTALTQLLMQGSLLIIGLVVGVAAAGELRAGLALFGGCIALIVGLNLHYLPQFSADLSPSRFTMFMAMRVYGIVVGLGCLLTLGLSPILVPLLFGGVSVSWVLRVELSLLYLLFALGSPVALWMRTRGVHDRVVLVRSRGFGAVIGLAAAWTLASGGLTWSVAGVLAGFGAFLVAILLFGESSSRGAGRWPPPELRRQGSTFAFYYRTVNTPGLARLFVALRPRLRPNWPVRETGLVIEGFPRSANTGVSIVAECAWPQLRISSHLHSHVAVHAALRCRVPVLVLVRDPVDACASLLVREGNVQPEQALRWYREYYRSVSKVAGSVTLIPFESATALPSELVIQLERQLHLPRPDAAHLELSVSELRRQVDMKEEAFLGTWPKATAVARPNASRGRLLDLARNEIVDPALALLLGDCRRLYQELKCVSVSGVRADE